MGTLKEDEQKEPEWDVEVLKCAYCGREAEYETHVNGIYVCNQDECKLQFCEEEALIWLGEREHE